jgi:hypothetical protein
MKTKKMRLKQRIKTISPVNGASQQCQSQTIKTKNLLVQYRDVIDLVSPRNCFDEIFENSILLEIF